MTADEYKTALAALNMSQAEAAKALGIGLRTSSRYALIGAPKHIELALQALTLKRRKKRAA
ncbi:helix-turn-helix domain-containing protein [Rhizobium ruizarguesonis]|uniref:hypothetical protein n=1 Tax=Rhizobium ruizarguesonis TaxID=2081791 RepID=UPI0013EE707E|nr:hypothetical protein [Rhizobium ruizarguesonis]